jgi:predicted CoA-binding protein
MSQKIKRRAGAKTKGCKIASTTRGAKTAARDAAATRARQQAGAAKGNPKSRAPARKKAAAGKKPPAKRVAGSRRPAGLARHEWYSDSHIRGILKNVRSIAFVGASTRWLRPSYYAMKYLQKKGFKIIPINPARGGDTVLGERVYASLKEFPGTIDMVDIFRTSEEAGKITDAAIAVAKDKEVKVLWMQLGVRDDEAAARAEAAGLTVIMNRCPKIEYGRLSGELSTAGINSRIVTAKTVRGPKA